MNVSSLRLTAWLIAACLIAPLLKPAETRTVQGSSVPFWITASDGGTGPIRNASHTMGRSGHRGRVEQ